MKKLIACMCILSCLIAVAAGVKSSPRSVALKSRSADATWITTVTTNDDNTVTKVMTKGTNTVTLVWHNADVPFRFRAKFHKMSDEDKDMALGAVDMPKRTEQKPANPIKSKGPEPEQGDENLTEEIYLQYSR